MSLSVWIAIAVPYSVAGSVQQIPLKKEGLQKLANKTVAPSGLSQ